MPGSSDYTSHLSAEAVEAVEFIVSLTKRKQKVVLDIADGISRQPNKISDHQTKDAVGRDIENLILGEFQFTYWVDHAVKEIRITEIAKV